MLTISNNNNSSNSNSCSLHGAGNWWHWSGVSGRVQEYQHLREHEVENLLVLHSTVFHVLFPVLITIGILTNILNLVILTRPTMRNKSYRWLRWLATVDIVLCSLTIPVCLATGGYRASSYNLAFYYAHFGWSLCIAWQTLSFYLMGWFAYDRFLAICCHDKFPNSHKVFEHRLGGSVVWVAILYTPTLAVGRLCPLGESWVPIDGYMGGMENVWYRGYAWVREIFSRVVPAVVLTVCNVKISYRLKHLRNIRDGFGSGVSPARRERERRLVLLLFWVTACFYLYNTPVTIYYLAFLNHSDKYSNYSLLIFGAICNLLQMTGNIFNFVLYFLINPDFQRALRVLFHLKVPDGIRDLGRDSIKESKSFQTTPMSAITVVPPDSHSDPTPPDAPNFRSYNS
ncbi:probable G-protein coupled receptor B0563.6 [Cherax quadricarinatus]|uniref:probable G-protein coupled receptor B0563.6 n=1 Tax=Cherax quadricarinatus TaxID=27406 RepID=UPI00387EBC4E